MPLAGESPSVSVILSSYNYERFIAEAIESVFEQSVRPLELVIVDDASTDGSTEIIRRLCTAAPIPTKVILRDQNGGQAAAWNHAFAACSGRIVCFLDSDDYWYPGKLETLLGFHEKFPRGAVYQHQLDTDYGVKRGALISADIFGLLRAWDNGVFNIPDDHSSTLFSPFAPTSGLSFRRDILARIFPIPAEIRTCPDAYLTRTSIAFGSLVSIPESLGVWRHHGANAGLKDQADFQKYWLPVILPALNRFYAANDLNLRLEYDPRRRSRASAAIMLGEYQRYSGYRDAPSYRKILEATGPRGWRALPGRAIGKLRSLARPSGLDPSGRDVAVSAAPRVDVVVAVHDALDETRRCLESVCRSRSALGQLILVDDGSQAPARAYLEAFARVHPRVTLLRNETARGYTVSANQGLRASTGEYVVLLNSDTIVPRGWLSRLLECADSASSIGIIGPLSNAASYQSIPERRAPGGGWAVNPLPLALSVDDMAAIVARVSTRRFPRVPFLNGFCYMIGRRVIDNIGLLDETTFPFGYGEEDDYSVRARDAGFDLAVADHGYVYHAKSASFGHEERARLSAQGHAALRAKHGADRIEADVRRLESLTEMPELAARLSKQLDSDEIPALLDRLRRRGDND